MAKTLRTLGLVCALYACAILAGCGSTTEFWKPDTQVTEQPVGPPRTEVSHTTGWLEMRLTRPTKEQRTKVERLTLLHEVHESTIDWDGVAMTIIYILGSLVILGINALIYFTAIDNDEDE